MNKFKVGDTVRIKTFDEMVKQYNLERDIEYYYDNGCLIDLFPSFVSSMFKMLGKEVVIDKVLEHNIDGERYDDTYGDGMYEYHEDWLNAIRKTNDEVF